MPIDTSLIVPIGNKLTMPEGQDPFRALFSGVASGYQAGQQWSERRDAKGEIKKDFNTMFGSDPTKSEMKEQLASRGIREGNFLTDFTQGVLGARAINTATADPLFGEKQADAREDIRTKRNANTLDEQLNRNAGDLMKEFGSLTNTEERLQFIQRNSGFALRPDGARLFDQFNKITGDLHKIESQTTAGLLKLKQAQDAVELATKYGGKIGDPASMVMAQKRREVETKLLPDADKMGAILNRIDDDWFDANGNLDTIKSAVALSTMPRQNRTGSGTPLEQARTLIAVNNLMERMKAGQLDEKKFQLELLKMTQEIENDFTLRNKPEERQRRIESLQNAFKSLGLGSNSVTLPPELQRFLDQGLTTAPAPPVATPKGDFQSTDSPPSTSKRTPSATPKKYRFQNGRLVPIE